jgi:hypothetical protein
VALKLLAADAHGKAMVRFLREAELCAALRHPGIVTVHAVGDHGGLPYIAYELLEGAAPLDDAWEGRSLPERVELIARAAEAVGHAHAAGVVHRDLKPDNVLVDGSGQLKVVDFGLGLSDSAERLTQTGAVIGTPLFLSPEQAVGDRKRLGPQTDVWALGVILYQALTGRLPFQGTSLTVLLSQIVQAQPKPPHLLERSVPVALSRLCTRCLRLRPQDRPPDGRALADELRAALEQGETSRTLKHVVGALAAVAFVGGFLVVLVEPSPPAEPASAAGAPTPPPTPEQPPAPASPAAPPPGTVALPRRGPLADLERQRRSLEELLVEHRKACAARARPVGLSGLTDLAVDPGEAVLPPTLELLDVARRTLGEEAGASAEVQHLLRTRLRGTVAWALVHLWNRYFEDGRADAALEGLRALSPPGEGAEVTLLQAVVASEREDWGGAKAALDQIEGALPARLRPLQQALTFRVWAGPSPHRAVTGQATALLQACERIAPAPMTPLETPGLLLHITSEAHRTASRALHLTSLFPPNADAPAAALHRRARVHAEAWVATRKARGDELGVAGFWLVQLDLAVLDAQAARATFERVRSEIRNQRDLSLLEAEILLLEGERVKARHAYGRVILHDDGGTASACMALAVLARRRGDADAEALQVRRAKRCVGNSLPWRRWQEIGPEAEDAGARHRLARLLREEGR